MPGAGHHLAGMGLQWGSAQCRELCSPRHQAKCSRVQSSLPSTLFLYTAVSRNPAGDMAGISRSPALSQICVQRVGASGTVRVATCRALGIMPRDLSATNLRSFRADNRSPDLHVSNGRVK